MIISYCLLLQWYFIIAIKMLGGLFFSYWYLIWADPTKSCMYVTCDDVKFMYVICKSCVAPYAFQVITDLENFVNLELSWDIKGKFMKNHGKNIFNFHYLPIMAIWEKNCKIIRKCLIQKLAPFQNWKAANPYKMTFHLECRLLIGSSVE